ncbi:MAG: hypothetical protein AAFX52_12490 [Pseudomonadota bacterium]
MSDQDFFLLQCAILSVIVSLFIGTAFFQLKPDQLDGPKWRALLGAGIFGIMFGLVIVNVALPLRIEGRAEDAPSWLPAVFLVVFALRSDRVTAIPLLGKPLRAYRVATLRRTITQSRQRLDKLGAAGDTNPSNSEE